MYIPHTSPPVQPRPVSPDFASSFFVLRFFFVFLLFFLLFLPFGISQRGSCHDGWLRLG